MFCNFFPGGCAVMSIPHSKMFCSSSNFTSAFPPPNNSANTSPKFLFISLNFSSNCSFIIAVMSVIIFLSFDIVFSRSSRCSLMKS